MKHELPDFRDISVWKGRLGLARFSQDGKFAAINGNAKEIIVYNIETGKIQSRLSGRSLAGFSFSPDGEYAVGHHARDLSHSIFDLSNGSVVKKVKGVSNFGRFLIFLTGGIVHQRGGISPPANPEMESVYLNADWQTILADNVSDKTDRNEGESASRRSDKSDSRFLLIGPSSHSIISNFEKFMLVAVPTLKKVSLWNLGSGALEKEVAFKKKIVACRFSWDDSYLAISDDEGVTRVFKTEGLELVTSIGSKKSKGIVVGWNRAGTKVLIQAKDGKGIGGYDSTSGKFLFDFPDSSSGETSIGNTSEMLLTKPKNDNSVLFHLWETDTGKLLASVPRRTGEKSASFIKWSADDSMIAVTEGIKTRISVWNIKGERLQTLANSSMPMQFSHDGRYLITGGISTDDPKVDMGYIWELVR
ncbi:MAG: hypothetical protein IPM21_09730 [Acidobacteria bacterium]|nr:hypothetical protein [Acidobacteriota bacterium]